MNYKGILFFLGIYSLLISLFSILNIFYSIYFDFIIGINSYLITFFTSVILGSSFYYVGRNHSKDITLTDQIIFILLSFLLIPFLISIPYLLSIYDISLLNAYFESVSGFTTTGFSILYDVQEIDEPLVLWRSSSQWLGGLFFLISIALTLGVRKVKIKPMYFVTNSYDGGNYYYNFSTNIFKIFFLYAFITFLILVLFLLAKIRFFDSLNLSFTIISAGGFLPRENLNNI